MVIGDESKQKGPSLTSRQIERIIKKVRARQSKP
jgi:hypothetical protein